jgi:hypothetical protein
LGDITVEKNKTLPDASERERFILATMSFIILWMGVNSPFLTRRTASATDTIRKSMQRQQWPEEATRQLPGVPHTPSVSIPIISVRVGSSDQPATSLERSGNR